MVLLKMIIKFISAVKYKTNTEMNTKINRYTAMIQIVFVLMMTIGTNSMYLADNESKEKLYVKSDYSYVDTLELMLQNYTAVELYDDNDEIVTTFTRSLCEGATKSESDDSGPCNCYCSGHTVEQCECAKQCDGSGCCYNSYMKFYYICEVHACCNSGDNYGCPDANAPTCEDGCGM